MSGPAHSLADERGAETRRMIHANAFLIGSAGVLLRGPSGSGKSALTRELIALAQGARLFARLIGDDRVEPSFLNFTPTAASQLSIAMLHTYRPIFFFLRPYFKLLLD